MSERTPILKIENIKNGNLFVKREDLYPDYFGGNKVRIAYELFEDMQRQGKDCIVGYGNARSNLCRVLSIMCSAKGIPCYIISPADEDGNRVETNNSQMVKLCGAKFRECTKNNVAETVETVFSECKEAGLNPYYIYGDKFGNGNEATPVRAYAKVYKEIKEQSELLGVCFDYIFLATGTGMTHAGLIAGQKIYGGSEQIVGISVARKKEQEIAVLKKYLDAYAQEVPFTYEDSDINLVDDYLCGGYGQYHEGIVNTLRTSVKEYGMPLDPTYTGKAFYGMEQYVKEHNLGDKNILFLHTGGTPLFFDNLNKL